MVFVAKIDAAVVGTLSIVSGGQDQGVIMNAELSRLAMLCLSTVLGLVVIGATVVSSLVAWKRPEDSTAALLGLVQGGNSIRLLTTLGVVLVTCFLALANSLSDGAIAVLSSIVGFMLGGIKREAAESGERREGAGG